MNKKWFFIFLSLPVFLFSQDIENELWTKIGYRYKLNKTSSFSLESGARYDLNPILFSKQFLDLSSSCKVNNVFSIESGVRLTKMPNQKSLVQRIYFSVFYKRTFSEVKFSWRSRIFSE